MPRFVFGSLPCSLAPCFLVLSRFVESSRQCRNRFIISVPWCRRSRDFVASFHSVLSRFLRWVPPFASFCCSSRCVVFVMIPCYVSLCSLLLSSFVRRFLLLGSRLLLIDRSSRTPRFVIRSAFRLVTWAITFRISCCCFLGLCASCSRRLNFSTSTATQQYTTLSGSI